MENDQIKGLPEMPESDIQFVARVLRRHMAGDQVTRSDLNRLDALVAAGYSYDVERTGPLAPDPEALR